MDNKVTTFKELIRLFYDYKHCRVIPVLNESNFVKGYFLKKNIIAKASDSSFLVNKIKDSENELLSKANSKNEGDFLEQLGELESFPVLFPDNTFKQVTFTDFITDYIPLKYEVEELEALDTGNLKDDRVQEEKSIHETHSILKQNDKIIKETEIEMEKTHSKKTARDLFETNEDKVKPFFEEFDFNGSFDLVAYLEGIEKRVIHKYLKYYDYNITHTADALKIPRQTLQYKIKKFNL
jgi:DNA-binding protein Fis